MKYILYLFIVSSIFLFAFSGCPAPPQTEIEVGPVWLTFTRANSPLVDNKINNLYVDGEGKVWFATDSGASNYIKNSWSSIKDSLSWVVFGQGTQSIIRKVTSITEGKSGSLWFGLGGGGVVRYNRFSGGKVWQRYNQANQLPCKSIYSLTSERSQTREVWIATNCSVSRYIPSQTEENEGVWIQYYFSDDSFIKGRVQIIASNPFDNSIWMGTDGRGLVSYDFQNWQLYSLPPQLGDRILSLAFDNNNTMWVSTWDGVGRLNIGDFTWTVYNHTQNTNGVLPIGKVTSVLTDFNKTRWFGTEKGLVRLSDTTWTLFNRSNTPELPSDTITSLSFDKKVNLWIGTTRGVAVYNPDGTQIK